MTLHFDAERAFRYRKDPERAAIPAPVTDKMMDAGRATFRRHRRQLDDLWQCFDSDRDAFLKAIYRAMARAS